MSVVLPAPLVPMRPTTSPARTSIDASTTTGRPANETRHVAWCAAGAAMRAARGVRSATGGRRARATDVCVRRCGGFQSVRRAMNASTWSRTLSTIEISPPGQYRSRISMPTPLANSWSCGAALEHRGDGDDHERAEHRAGDRRQAADHRDGEDAERLGRREVVGDLRGVAGREEPTGERGHAPRDREGDELGPRRRHGVRRGVVLVVAHREERPADARCGGSGSRSRSPRAAQTKQK